MNFIENLKSALPQDFPLVTHLLLAAVETRWQKELTGLSRLQKFQPDAFTAANQSRLTELHQILKVIQPLLAKELDTPENIAQLISHCDDIDIAWRLDEWTDYLSMTLLKEPNPLPLLMTMDADSPLQFAGFVLCLLKKNIATDEILNSGILHRFHGENLHNLDYVVETFELLKTAIKPEHTNYHELGILLDRATKTRASTREGFEQFALDGSKSQHTLSQLAITPPEFTVNTHPANLDKLYALFGQQFFIQLLHELAFKKHNEYKPFLLTILDGLDTDKIKAIYRFIATSVAMGERSTLLKELGALLSSERMQSLLKIGDPWIILNSKPALLKYFSSEDLTNLMSAPITQYNYKEASSLCTNPLVYPFTTDVYRHIFELFFVNPTLLADDQDHKFLLSAMRAHQDTKSWCTSAVEKLRETLTNAINKAGTPFTVDDYREIYDLYCINKGQRDVLIQLSQTELGYPQGNYELQSFIIRRRYEQDPSFDILACIKSIHDASNTGFYSEEDCRKSQIRTLYECLANEDQPKLQEKIIQLLTQAFQETQWMSQLLGGTTYLVDQALVKANKSLLERYFPNYINDELRMTQLKVIDARFRTEKKQSLIQYFLTNSTGLELVLALYPKQQLLTILKEKVSVANGILPLAARNLAALRAIMAALPPEDIETALADKNEHGQTILHLAPINCDALRYILSMYPNHHALISALMDKNHHGNTVLHLAGHYPDSLQIILEQFADDETRFNAILEKNNHGATVLHNAADNLKSLELILSLYQNDAARLQAVKETNIFGQSLLHMARDNPQSLSLILELYPEEARYEAVNKRDRFDLTLMQLLSRNPSALQAVLDLLPHNKTTALATNARFYHRELNPKNNNQQSADEEPLLHK